MSRLPPRQQVLAATATPTRVNAASRRQSAAATTSTTHRALYTPSRTSIAPKPTTLGRLKHGETDDVTKKRKYDPMSSSKIPMSMTTRSNNMKTPGEERILVAIRMRPLNSREQQSSSGSGDVSSNTNTNRVWHVVPKSNSITQCTTAGKPLPERTHNQTFFSYDKTFGESSTTREVYEDTSRGIVESVVHGLNGTIFAYGQTSSGKTFTMQGSGILQDGATTPGSTTTGQEINDAGWGIVHMAARDIFNHIEKDADRVFLIRVSFIEIYNEEVRDLLVSRDSRNNATPLKVREDKHRGVFVNSNETIVASMDSLLSVLFAGEKNRSVAATGMNERSSRSHTIFRIIVESRLKDHSESGKSDDVNDGEDEDMQRDNDARNNGAVRISTLNLVDLAGSESVRNTGATGHRQKKAGIINQSLLTLSRVIVSVGQNASHVSFRDSILTRILQPSLSGNARMAVICCATPSELYLEETRSTLQFASRAKLVKTRAQLNEVMDDRSLIKKLQRELKEARNGGPGQEAMKQMKALEEKAANAEYAYRKAVEDVKRMKELILKGGVLPSSIKSEVNMSSHHHYGGEVTAREVHSSPSTCNKSKAKRRYSDSVITNTENIDTQHQLGHMTNSVRSDITTTLHAQEETKPKESKPSSHFMSFHYLTNDVNIGLLREALSAKSAQAMSLKAKLMEVEQDIESTTAQLQHERGDKEMLRLEKQDLQSQVSTLASDKDIVVTECELVVAEKDRIAATAQKTIGKQSSLVAELQDTVSSLQFQLATMGEEHGRDVQLLNDQVSRQQAELEAGVVAAHELERQLQVARDDIDRLSTGKNNSDNDAAIKTNVNDCEDENTEDDEFSQHDSEEQVESMEDNNSDEEIEFNGHNDNYCINFSEEEETTMLMKEEVTEEEEEEEEEVINVCDFSGYGDDRTRTGCTTKEDSGSTNAGTQQPGKRKCLTWDERFEQWIEFKNEFGHCNVPKGYNAKIGLALWVQRQRRQYRHFHKGAYDHFKCWNMSIARIDKIDGLEFDWGPHEYSWDVFFKKLEQYKREHGHCNVPRRYEADQSLGEWVHKQRQDYRNFNNWSGNLWYYSIKERINKLEGLGFDMSVRS